MAGLLSAISGNFSKAIVLGFFYAIGYLRHLTAALDRAPFSGRPQPAGEVALNRLT